MEGYELRNLSFTYPGGNAPALEGVSLTVAPGEFITLCGPSGSGKSTLLRLLKPSLAPAGVLEGALLLDGRPLSALERREECLRVGFVGQEPWGQMVTDQVWHELAFTLESLGLPSAVIRARVAEMAAFFGLEPLFRRNLAELSGGQLQLVCLASAMAAHPQVLLLDEPTAQLDPVAAEEFLNLLARLNRELGTTILLSEHRLEQALPLSHRAVVLDSGRVLCDAPPARVGQTLFRQDHPMFRAMPTPMRVFSAVEGTSPAPLTVGEGRRWLEQYSRTRPLAPVPEPPSPAEGEVLLRARELWFRYDRQGPYLLRGLSLEARRGQCLAVLGGNGAGKSTLLTLLAGTKAPLWGKVSAGGRRALLPQEPGVLFSRETVGEEWSAACASSPLAQEARQEILSLCALPGLEGRNPHDLSGGEAQRLALGLLLLRGPEVLLLDEPTKGLDAARKEELGQFLALLLSRGLAVVVVSHDTEFCARYANRCLLLFDGEAAAEAPARGFFSENRFYTTAAGRMARQILPRVVTAEELCAACLGGRATESPPLSRGAQAAQQSLAECAPAPPAPVCLPDSAPLPEAAPPAGEPPPASGQRGRSTLWTAGTLALMTATTLWGSLALGDRKYYFVSLLILLEGFALLCLRLEGARPRARELTLLAVLSAAGVALRGAFFMLPQAKPVMALVIWSGAALGPGPGFLVGAATMLLSNLLFMQGPWTPWQMLAMGLTGFCAGGLFRRGRLRSGRVFLALYGLFASVVLYGGVVNPATVLIFQGELSLPALLAACAAGLPMDLTQGFFTALFLWGFSPPMLYLLGRARDKHGLRDPDEGQGEAKNFTDGVAP